MTLDTFFKRHHSQDQGNICPHQGAECDVFLTGNAILLCRYYLQTTCMQMLFCYFVLSIENWYWHLSLSAVSLLGIVCIQLLTDWLHLTKQIWVNKGNYWLGQDLLSHKKKQGGFFNLNVVSSSFKLILNSLDTDLMGKTNINCIVSKSVWTVKVQL